MSIDAQAQQLHIILEKEAPLAPLTYFKIGGPAEYLARPRTNEEFISVIRLAQGAGIPITMLGGGANVLIADQGIRGLVIHPENRQYRREDTRIIAGAGVTNGQLLGFSIQEGLAGLENLAGVPGTVGGDIYGNAGMFPAGVAPAVHDVLLFSGSAGPIRISVSECGFAYRTSRFKTTKEIIIEASFELATDERSAIAGRVRDMIATHKRGVQPTSEPCSGCMFKNPEGDYAARLIDQAGLKGKRIGGAEVSRLHANFIINTGTATADHVLQLMSYIKQQIRDRYGIQLQEEVQLLGFSDTQQSPLQTQKVS